MFYIPFGFLFSASHMCHIRYMLFLCDASEQADRKDQMQHNNKTPIKSMMLLTSSCVR